MGTCGNGRIRRGGEAARTVSASAFLGRADARVADIPTILRVTRRGFREAGKTGRGEEEPRAFYEIRGRGCSVNIAHNAAGRDCFPHVANASGTVRYEVTGLCSQGLSASPWSRCST